MKIKVNLFRTISAFVLLITGIVMYILFRKNNKGRNMIISAVATLSGLGLIGLEIEKNFKPIEEVEYIEDKDLEDKE